MGGDNYDSKKRGEGVSNVSEALFDEDDYEPIPPLNQPRTEVKPEDLTLSHRIGRGPFGDVWLATIHSHREDFDEYHEVAVKVLPSSIPEDQVRVFTDNLHKNIFSVVQPGAPSNVNWPRGISMKNGKACVITKMYDMSIGDKMARLPGNCLPLADALRYGINLVQGILELHSHEIMALNLKPYNFLLDEHDQAVLGEFGIPYLLMGAISAEGPLVWLGTPNYMAPEQWEPKLRGPIVFETDSWGFACSLIEMLTGEKPFNQKSPADIFHAVVEKGEKPAVPSGLPGALQRMLKSCLAYDPRDRPTFSEILAVLQSPNGVFKEGDWITVADKSHKQEARIGVVKKVKGPESMQMVFCDKPEEPVEYTGLSNCSLWRDAFEVGDTVQLKSSTYTPRFRWHEQLDATGTVTEVDKENALFIVKFGESRESYKADPADIRLVLDGICVGDSVRLRDGWSGEASGRSPSNMGKVHRILRKSRLVHVAFLGRELLWEGPVNSLVKVQSLQVGQFVKLKNEVTEPRFDWLVKKGHVWETGKITTILPNGALMVDFPGRLWNRKCCWADLEEVEVVRLNECNGIVEKYEHLQSMHWAIGPALCLLGFLAAARVGTVLGSLVIGGRRRKTITDVPKGSGESASPGPNMERQITEYRGSGDGKGNPAWLPPAVASILFKEGAASSS